MSGKSKLLIEIVALILVLILMVVLVFLSGKGQDSTDQNDTTTHEIARNEQIDNNTAINTASSNDAQDEKKLVKVTNTKMYFLIKQCIVNYYSSLINEQDLSIIDNKAKKDIDVGENEILSYSYIPKFNIDKIYMQEIDGKENMYVVYYRAENGNSNYKELGIMVRINTENKIFSIFPYEYLKKNSYLDLDENDTVDTNNLETISQGNLNTYSEQSSVDTVKYITELFDRYKFDLLFDNENLYRTISDEYKNLKFATFQDFKNYLNSNKSELSKEQLKEYKKTVYESYTELIGSTNENRNYVFMVKNIMDYSISFDEYSVVTQESKDEYDKLLSQAKAKICIDRVIEAINNKDYDFVYDRLNPILKNNYYKTKQDFIQFCKNNFFDNNLYEIQENYLKVSQNIYQFDVKIYNADGDVITNNWFKFAITLNDDAEFKVSIVKK